MHAVSRLWLRTYRACAILICGCPASGISVGVHACVYVYLMVCTTRWCNTLGDVPHVVHTDVCIHTHSDVHVYYHPDGTWPTTHW